MLSHEEGRNVFEKTVHAMGNDHSDFSVMHSRPFLNSVFFSDFVCALHSWRVQTNADVHFR